MNPGPETVGATAALSPQLARAVCVREGQGVRGPPVAVHMPTECSMQPDEIILRGRMAHGPGFMNLVWS